MEEHIESRFTKIGDDFISLRCIERFIFLDSDLYLSTIAGKESTVEHSRDEERDKLMQKIARKINEKAHDIVYLEPFTKKNEELLSGDLASNRLYRQWLERRWLAPERRKIKAIKSSRKKKGK